MIKEFKEFLMRGNVLDLAVGVVIGGAFTSIVNQCVEGLITPLIGLVVSLFTKKGDLDSAMNVLDVRINGVKFEFGSVVSAIITFIITGFVLFIIVKFANRAKELRHKEEVEEEPEITAEDYLKDIRDLLEAQGGPAAKKAREDLNNSEY